MAAAAACDKGDGSYGVPMDAPPKIIGTTFDAFRGADGAVTGMPIQPQIVLRFDRVLAPSSVSRANYRLASGPLGNVEFLEPRIDPVERTVVLRLQVPLATGTRYDLHVRGSPDVTTQLAAFDGARFEGEAVFSFTTEGAVKPGEGSDSEPAKIDPCVALNILSQGCTGISCHGSDDATKPPVLGLNFFVPAAVSATAIGQPATLVSREAGGAAGLNVRAFPYGMSIIHAGSSSESLLMYKLLMHPVSGPLPAASTPFDVPGLDSDPTNAKTAAELSKHVPGMPMPHPDRPSSPGVPGSVRREGLSWEQLRTLRGWIDQGAVVPPACGS